MKTAGGFIRQKEVGSVSNLGFLDAPAVRPFSIMLVNLAFNATRNSRIKPKKC